VIRKEEAVADATLKLKENAVVGTSSARRKAQLLHFRPDIQLKDIRGNVPTRLNKLREGQFDGIVLAAAGLSRLELDLSEFEVIKFSPKEFIPAPAQGVLAWQTNEKDVATRRIFKQLHQSNTSIATNVERRVLRLLDGGCQMPLGVYCEQDRAGNFHVWAALAEGWDQPLKTTRLSSSTHFQLAEQVFEQIKS
jgi:hydroxymethylbilane synthase